MPLASQSWFGQKMSSRDKGTYIYILETDTLSILHMRTEAQRNLLPSPHIQNNHVLSWWYSQESPSTFSGLFTLYPEFTHLHLRMPGKMWSSKCTAMVVSAALCLAHVCKTAAVLWIQGKWGKDWRGPPFPTFLYMPNPYKLASLRIIGTISTT